MFLIKKGYSCQNSPFFTFYFNLRFHIVILNRHSDGHSEIDAITVVPIVTLIVVLFFVQLIVLKILG